MAIPRVAVVVCSLGRRPGLDVLVRQLLDQHVPLEAGRPRFTFEVVVVDNDPSSAAVRNALAGVDREPGVRVLAEPRRGLARARNRALAHLAETGFDVVAYTDDDCDLGTHWLAALTDPLCGPGAHDLVGCVTGRTIALEPGTRAEELFEEFGSFTRGAYRCCWTPDGSPPPAGLGVVGERPTFFPYSGVFGTGNNMAFRTSVLRRIGGFSASLGAGSAVGGGEDLYAFLRVLEVGSAIVYEPAAVLRHRHRSDMAALQEQVRTYGSGLAAMVLHHVVSHPRALPRLLRALPAGVRHLLDPGSDKNARRSEDFPRRLAVTELLGVAQAPALYVQARWHEHDTDRRSAAAATSTVRPDRRLRVLVPTDAQAALGGVEVSTLEVCEQLAARGHEIVLFAAAGGSLTPRWERAAARTVTTPLLTVPVTAPWRAVTLVPAVLAARRARPDVVWLNRAEQLLFAAAAGGLTGAPVVCQLRHAPFAAPAVRALRGRAERYLAVSVATRQEWIRAGLDPQRIEVVHNGIDVADYPAPTPAHRAAARLALGIPADADVVLHYGRLTVEKGIEVLRDSLPLLRARAAGRDVRVLLVGDLPGAGRTHHDWLAAAPEVTHLPARTGSELLQVLHAADVVALPALAPEPFGRVVVEAMATGLPVVASRTGGIPEILTGEFTDFLVVPGDPDDLARALAGALRRRREDPDLSRRTRDHVARAFSLRATVDAVEGALLRAARANASQVASPGTYGGVLVLPLPPPAAPSHVLPIQPSPSAHLPQEVDLR
ncbi:glycosyltransferase [Kineococcus sp. GCM10028916]